MCTQFWFSTFFPAPVNLKVLSNLGRWFGYAEGLPCEFEGILPSPVVDGYRNKCEFAIGMGPDGKQRVVGFQLGSFRSDLPPQLMHTYIHWLF